MRPEGRRWSKITRMMPLCVRLVAVSLARLRVGEWWRGSLDIEYLGSARDDAELELLKAGSSTGPQYWVPHPGGGLTEPGDERLARLRRAGAGSDRAGIVQGVPAEPQNDPGQCDSTLPDSTSLDE
jgi:hypothetical protein